MMYKTIYRLEDRKPNDKYETPVPEPITPEIGPKKDNDALILEILRRISNNPNDPLFRLPPIKPHRNPIH